MKMCILFQIHDNGIRFWQLLSEQLAIFETLQTHKAFRKFENFWISNSNKILEIWGNEIAATTKWWKGNDWWHAFCIICDYRKFVNFKMNLRNFVFCWLLCNRNWQNESEGLCKHNVKGQKGSRPERMINSPEGCRWNVISKNAITLYSFRFSKSKFWSKVNSPN